MRGRKPTTPIGSDIIDLPTSKIRIPDIPTYLKGRSRQVWEMVTRTMVSKNLYDIDCRELTAVYCIQLARLLDSEDKIATQGAIVKRKRYISARAKVPKEVVEEAPNPSIETSDRACDRLLRISAELGLTPISRKRASKVRSNASTAAASKFLKAG